MEPITTGDIRNEYREIKNEKDFLEFVNKYPTRVYASVKIMIDGDSMLNSPYIYWQDGDLFFEEDEC